MELHLAAFFGFLLATLAVTSFGAPVEQSIKNHSCGHAIRTASNTGNHGGRHGTAKLICGVGHQIALAMAHFNKEKKIINNYYNEVQPIQKESFMYDWLPQNQSVWYRKETRSIKRGMKVKKVFEKFMSSLQIFSATFEELKKFRLGEKEEKEEKDRYNIIDNIHTELIRVLCEVEWTLMCLNAIPPEGKAENILSKTENWNKNPKGTMLKVQDWGVILFFKAYLKDWEAIVNSLKKKNSCKLTAHNNKEKKSKKQKTKGKNHAS
jgi:hypothetical protein